MSSRSDEGYRQSRIGPQYSLSVKGDGVIIDLFMKQNHERRQGATKLAYLDGLLWMKRDDRCMCKAFGLVAIAGRRLRREDRYEPLLLAVRSPPLVKNKDVENLPQGSNGFIVGWDAKSMELRYYEKG